MSEDVLHEARETMSDDVVNNHRAIRSLMEELSSQLKVLKDEKVVLESIRTEQEGFLAFGRVLDTTRMRTELGFEPRYTTLETLDDFIERGGTEPLIGAGTWRALERRAVSAATAIQ